MIYEVIWRPGQGQVRSPSRFATWDAKVVDSTPALSWAVGRSYSEVVDRLERRYGATVREVPNTHRFRTI